MRWVYCNTGLRNVLGLEDYWLNELQDRRLIYTKTDYIFLNQHGQIKPNSDQILVIINIYGAFIIII